MERAIAFGLGCVKFFPAEQAGGLDYLKAVSAPYPMLKYIPTGGISEKNLREYLDFPKILACGGSWICPKDMIHAGKWGGITALCKKAMEAKSDAPKIINDQLSIVNSKKVVTFGELMLRLAPEGYLRFVQAERFQATMGGAEANVAVDLACLGAEAAFVTKLPAHEIGQLAVNALRRFGVDTGHILRGGSRVGVYYCEKGASQRASKVIYDRAGSSIAEAKPGEFDWDAILAGAGWFHFTGITPALSEGCAALCLEACRAAQSRGIPVSCDLNYRKNLWSREQASRTMERLMPHVTLLIANEEDAADVFGIHAGGSDIEGGALPREGYADVARQLSGRFGIPEIAITLRQSISASDNVWAGMLYSGGACHFSREYPVHIVDRVGGGDSFGAGLIFATLEGQSAQERLEFAVAASCLKHSVEGDFNVVSADEARRLAGGSGSGRVQR
jgi:2-dehydro-3-deoxygluconokinase